jgi:hypothetical protein
MEIKAVFLNTGLVMGVFEEVIEGYYKINKPALVLATRDNVTLVPFLNMMEEQSITIESSDCLYGQVFTPITELRNYYNQVFGSNVIDAMDEDVMDDDEDDESEVESA